MKNWQIAARYILGRYMSDLHKENAKYYKDNYLFELV